jgi:bromodomain-containing protein 7/9
MKCLLMFNRKDDYAFFLKPVDPRLVPGYAEMIQRPMDLGTMTTKVSKGKYRSLEDFAVRSLTSDF